MNTSTRQSQRSTTRTGRVRQDVDWDNPFFAAHKREIERTRAMLVEQFGEKGQTAGEVLEEEQAAPMVSSRYDDVDQIIPRNR